MYLTENEVLILSGIKQGLRPYYAAKLHNIPFGMNDPRVTALLRKYGAKNLTELREKADLNKVVVCSRDEIPYFKYYGYSLVDTIKICKEDVKQLNIFFEAIDENEKYFELQTDEDGLGRTLDIIDKEEEARYNIRWIIDGEIENGSEKNWKLL